MTARELKREHKRRAMVEAGLDRMLAGSIEMLRSILNASSLAAAADIPKDTAYRVFRDADRGSCEPIIRAVSEAATEPRWSGFDQALAQVATKFDELTRNEIAFDEGIVEAMVVNVEAQFRSPGGPVGWLLHTAALTASPAWKGEQVLSDEDAAVGRELLAARAAFYRRMTDDLAPILDAGLALLGRRPKGMLDCRRLVSLMHALIDGAVLRLYAEPDAFSTRLVGEAVLALALGFSEAASGDDPRCPAGGEARLVYDAVVRQAGQAWPIDEHLTVAILAQRADVAPGDAEALFPSRADVADSVLWTKILGVGRPGELAPAADEAHGSEGELPMLFALLRRLRDVVDALPGAARIVGTEHPLVGPGIRHELQRQVAGVLGRNCPGVNADTTASELVACAFTGSAGWPAAAAVMRVLQGRSS